MTNKVQHRVITLISDVCVQFLQGVFSILNDKEFTLLTVPLQHF